MERGLPNSRIIRLRINPSNSLQRASTTQSPNRPVGARPGGLGVQTTGNTTRRASAPSQSARPPVVRNPEDGDELPPPPYSSQDPEPEATRILQERLAAETNVEPAAVPSPSTPQSASNPALASPHSSPAPTRPGLVDSNPPSDPQMAQIWEESQLDEAKRASLAWREQQEFEEAMRLSLAEAESMGVGSSTGPGTSTNTQSGQNRLPVVDENDEQDSSLSQQPNPDLMGLVGGLEDLTFSNSEQASSSNNATHNQSSILDDDGPSGLNQQPLVPSKTGLVMQSKNPFLSQSEKETSGANGSSSYLDNTASTPAQASANGFNQLPGRGSPGSTDTAYTPQPIYAPPPGPPLLISVSLLHRLKTLRPLKTKLCRGQGHYPVRLFRHVFLLPLYRKPLARQRTLHKQHLPPSNLALQLWMVLSRLHLGCLQGGLIGESLHTSLLHRVRTHLRCCASLTLFSLVSAFTTLILCCTEAYYPS